MAGAPWRGEERHLRELHDLAARLGVAGPRARRRLRRRRRPVYGAADIVAVPSKQPDPLPNAALEAAAAGCCVVAAAHGGLPEILRDGETGRLVAPATRPRWPRARRAGRRPGQRERLGAAAAADVRARFARERLLAEVQALYDGLLSAERRRRQTTASAPTDGDGRQHDAAE